MTDSATKVLNTLKPSSSADSVKTPLQTPAASSSSTVSTDLWQSIRKVMELQNQAPPLQPVDRTQPLPLSFAQEQLWWLEQLQPGKATYNLPFAFRLTGCLNVVALEQSLSEIIRRHEALRTTFAIADQHPTQVIVPAVPLSLPVLDWQLLAPAERDDRVLQVMQEEAQHPFDLTQAPLLRAQVICLSATTHLLLLTVHHIAFDGWSEGLLWHELTVLYEAFAAQQPSPLPELTTQYADIAVWQRQWLQGAALDAHLAYWQPQLHHLVPPQLPYDHPAPAVPTRQSDRLFLRLSSDLTQALKQLSRKQRSTLFTTLLAAFKVLLHGYSGQEDVFVCSPTANRNQSATKNLMGYFVNLLLLRSDLSGDPTFLTLLGRVHQTSSMAFAYQNLPLQQLVDALQLTRVPLARVMFALQNTPQQVPQFPELEVTPVDIDNNSADFDLFLSLSEESGHLVGVLKYDRDLFQPTTMSQLLGHFEALLAAIAANPTQSLTTLLSPLAIQRPTYCPTQASFSTVSESSGNSQERHYVAARDSLEQQLVQVWEQVLGIAPVGINDNFFDLGGNSLLAAKLFTQVQKVCGNNLTLDTLFRAATIESLATLLRQNLGTEQECLVPIRISGNKTPLFCIPAAGASALHFSQMVRYSDQERSFYGIQARGFDGQQAPQTQIPEMAADYLQAIRRQQPQGPYLLSGHCFGGLVAFEVAQQLQAQGEEVAMLVLFDANSPEQFRKRVESVNQRPPLRDRVMRNLTALLQGGDYLQRKWKDWSKRLRQTRQSLKSQVYQTLGQPLPHEIRHVPLLQAANQAIRCYQPERIFSGQIILFQATGKPTDGPIHYEMERGWGEYATQGVKIYPVPGNHHSMFSQPHIQTLTQRLAECLDAAELKTL